ncbi:MAG: hypothetical protein IPF55_08915 [Rhodoferax sp.]|nr:hypothetical protein [Rhodoferax sp.]
MLDFIGPGGFELGLELSGVGGQLEGAQLPHLAIGQAVCREQTVLALEVKTRQVNQRVGIGYEDLMLEDLAVHVLGRREQRVVVGLDGSF